ncbi:MAG: MBL fold metallo-hydrolase [Firmicutes bacterium]|nr:MBL fold metallo-hydrolase [Bacillota bacterium]
MYQKRNWTRFYRILVLVAAVLLAAGTWAQGQELTIHFLDVGQGDSILIQTPAGANILVDAGDTRAGNQVVVPYLQRLGVKSLDMVVITHPHFDHIGGLIPVLEKFTVGRVLADGQIHTSRTYENLLILIDQKGIPFRLARAGDKLEIPGLDEVLVLNPQEPFLKGLNNNSVVLAVTYGETSVLLTGDIEAEAERRILEGNIPARANILKVAHHGSRTSSTPEFLEAVQPDTAVISAGADNNYGHPHPETLVNLKAVGSQVFQTSAAGTIIVVSDGSSCRIVIDN